MIADYCNRPAVSGISVVFRVSTFTLLPVTTLNLRAIAPNTPYSQNSK